MFHKMIRTFTAVHLCYHAISVSSLDGLGTSKNKMHPQNKMLGSDPFYFHFIFWFFILKGAPAPSFYLGTPDGGALWMASVILKVYSSVLFNAKPLPCACCFSHTHWNLDNAFPIPEWVVATAQGFLSGFLSWSLIPSAQPSKSKVTTSY